MSGNTIRYPNYLNTGNKLSTTKTHPPLPYFTLICPEEDSFTMNVDAKIDVHAHFVPDFYADAARDAGHLPGPDGIPAMPVSFHTYPGLTTCTGKESSLTRRLDMDIRGASEMDG